MKSVVSYIHRLSVRLIASIVLFFAILGGLSGFLIYHVLKQSMLKENAILADQISDSIIDIKEYMARRKGPVKKADKVEAQALKNRRDQNIKNKGPVI